MISGNNVYCDRPCFRETFVQFSISEPGMLPSLKALEVHLFKRYWPGRQVPQERIFFLDPNVFLKTIESLDREEVSLRDIRDQSATLTMHASTSENFITIVMIANARGLGQPEATFEFKLGEILTCVKKCLDPEYAVQSVP